MAGGSAAGVADACRIEVISELGGTDVHRPAAAGAHPALLLRTPYGAAEPALIKVARILAGQGYAVVLQNVRGRYGSSGTFEPFAHEAADGRATLEWLAAQPWCDGRVVPWGISYSTYTAAALCAGKLPAGIRLAGMVSVAGMANPYRHFYRDGAFVLHWALPWYLLIAGPRSRKLGALDLRAAALGPLTAIPDLFGGPAGLWRDWLHWRFEDDEHWRHRDLVPALVRSRLPMLHVGGWYDFSLGSTLDLYTAMVASGAAGQRLVIGPWEHNETAEALFLALQGGERHRGAGGLAAEMLGALRTWLGEDAPPPRGGARIWAGGAAAEWQTLESWPPPAHLRTWHLAGSGAAGEARLAVKPPAGSWAVALAHDPDDPVPSLGGRCWAMPGWTSAGPLDQAGLAVRSDVLRLESPPLDRPLAVCGQPRARLWIERSGSPVDCCAKLVDVHPDGRRIWVTDGVAHSAALEAKVSGELAEIAVELGAVCHRFAPGHRLGLELAASSFPQFERRPERGTLRVLCGPAHPSRLFLPETITPPDFSAAQHQENSP